MVYALHVPIMIILW